MWFTGCLQSIEVYFDNLNIVHKKSALKERTDYYAFGLAIDDLGNSSMNGLRQDYKFNGKELQRELSYNVEDYGARHYDPVIGRWLQEDPVAEKFMTITPYAYGANNPLYFIDPDGRTIKPSTGEARTIIQYQLNSFNQNATLNQIFGAYIYGPLGTYNDPNGGSPNQGQIVNGFSLPGVTYGAAQKLLNADQTGLSLQQKLVALSWVRALGAIDVAEVGVYNNSQIPLRNSNATMQGGRISDNTFITENPALSPFMNALVGATTGSQRDAAINNFIGVATGTSGIPFLPNGPTPAGLAAPNLRSVKNQTLNIVGLYPIAGTVANGSAGVSNAIVNYGVSIAPVSVSDQRFIYRMNPDGAMTTTTRR